MSKDPAMLWYWSDWHSGTSLMSRFLKGCYIDLLHAQFNNGPLLLEEIKICLGADFGPAWPALQKKFKQKENLFFNERLEREKERRNAFTESRRQSRLGKTNNVRKTCDKHTLERMENTNTNENENEDFICITEKIKNEWIEISEKDLRKRMLSNSVADCVSSWLNEIGIDNKREVFLEHCRIDIGIFQEDQLILIIEAKNYREKNEYYKPLKQISKYSQFGLPIIFLPSIRQALDVIVSVYGYINTGEIDNSFVFIPNDLKTDFPKIEEVERVFRSQGGTSEMALAFFNKKQAVEWMDRGSQIKDFGPLVSNFIITWNKINKNGKINSPESSLPNAMDIVKKYS